MIGSSEAGLAETINYILTMFTADEQQRLVNNIFLTGAGAKFPGKLLEYVNNCSLKCV